MRERAAVYKACQAAVDTAEAQLRASQHAIKERLRTKQVRRVGNIASDGFSINWTPVKGRGGFDAKALSAAAAAAGVSVEEFEIAATPGDRLDVRVREAPSERKQERSNNGFKEGVLAGASLEDQRARSTLPVEGNQ
jgi:hypothetical protein